MKCKICDKNCKNFQGLSIHVVKLHKIALKDYYDKFLKKEDEGVCSECGRKTNFNRISKGYYKYCSNICAQNSKEIKEKKKQTNIKKFGAENPFQSEEIKEKIKQVNIQKYGVKHVLRSKKVQRKLRQTCLKKYGVPNPFQAKSVKKKVQQTNIEKYGVENPFQSEKIKKKIKQTSIKKYGVEHVLQSHIKNYDKWQDVEFIKNNFLIKNKYIQIQKIMKFFNIISRSNIYLHLKKLGIKYKRKNEVLSEDLPKWKLYCSLIRRETNRWVKEVYEIWDGYDYYSDEKLLTNEEYKKSNPTKHVSNNPLQPTIDHKISKYEGFQSGILPTVIGNITNLCICSRKSNSEKGRTFWHKDCNA
jgi:hypothetical protein